MHKPKWETISPAFEIKTLISNFSFAIMNNPEEREISRKRKNSSNHNGTLDFEAEEINKNIDNNMDHHEKADDHDEKEEYDLTLSLSFRPSRSKQSSLTTQLSLSPPPRPPPPQPLPLSQEISKPSEITTPRPLMLSYSHPLFNDIAVTDPSLYYNSPPPPVLHLQEASVSDQPSLYYPSPPTPTPSVVHCQEVSISGPSRLPRTRRNPSQGPREGKSKNVPAPFPWATNQRATVHSLEYLQSKEIDTITGDVQCKRCEKKFQIGFDLKDKFVEVGTFVADNQSSMHDRAPSCWMNPVLPTCQFCQQQNSAKPVIPEKKKEINWLFLLLGQMLGCCTLDQLKYFCKHTKNHRTGAKDRVLFLTYRELCKQLDPNGPFDP